MTDSTKRILILMSDTGGGHRSAAEAISDAFALEFPAKYTVELVDVIKRATAWPFNHMASWYLPAVTYAEWGWDLAFHATNHPATTRALNRLFRVLSGRRMRQIFRETQPDLVLSVHPLLTATARRLLRSAGSDAPFAVMVTDMTDGHRIWFDPGADLTLVATGSADLRARQLGVPAEKIRVVGQPVSLKYMARGKSKSELRQQLGIAADQTTILLVGGGEGMGPLYKITCAISAAHLPIQLVVIAGRNQALKQKLEATPFDIPVLVQGFVTNMPDWMRASDVIITKAGPGTICEALACGLPILLSGFLPGQEEGNVTYVEQNGVGVLREDPRAIAATLGEWLAPGADTIAQFSARARELARPGAVLEIAAILDDLLNSRVSAV